jgi:Protein of unknown function (DUF3443)
LSFGSVTLPVRPLIQCGLLSTLGLLSACFGGNGTSAAVSKPPQVLNTLTLTVDTGPAGASGAINHAYVTLKICAPGTQQCANIDHVLLDTGSAGLRLVRSVLTAQSIALSAASDAQGQPIEECVTFGGGQTWGPVALADVSLAGESAAKLPIQIMDDTLAGAPPPPTCGANGTLINGVSGFNANGVLGIGVFAQDCGDMCVNAGTPLPVYYGCTTAGVCSAENVALAAQVTNPVAMFAADNNGIVIRLPNLQNANGDASLAGEVIFGIGTQSDNALPATGLTVLGADSHGDFTATFNGSTVVLPALIDSGTDAFAFDDPSIAVCAAGAFVGYYCPAVAPQSVYVISSGVGVNNTSSTLNFAIADPNTFVANAAAFANLAGGGGSSRFTFGVPFFYGRTIYLGIDQRVAGVYTGPYYAY